MRTKVSYGIGYYPQLCAGAAMALIIMVILVASCQIAKAMPAQGGYAVRQVPGGTIQGKLLWVGKSEEPHRIAVTVDRAGCGTSKEMYDVRVEQGGVVGAVVWLNNITRGKAFDFPKPVLNQKDCMFVPAVVLMKPGHLEVMNSDKTTHIVHLFARFNPPSDQMMAPGAPPLELTLMHPETIPVRCDIHPWMQSYIVVAKNPYYVLSGFGGSFTLSDVPPGTYQLDVWQDKIGKDSQSVTIQAGKTTTVILRLGS